MLGNQIKKLKCALSTGFQSRMFDVTLEGEEVEDESTQKVHSISGYWPRL